MCGSEDGGVVLLLVVVLLLMWCGVVAAGRSPSRMWAILFPSFREIIGFWAQTISFRFCLSIVIQYYKFEITCPKKRRKILPTPSKRFKTLPAGTKNVR